MIDGIHIIILDLRNTKKKQTKNTRAFLYRIPKKYAQSVVGFDFFDL